MLGNKLGHAYLAPRRDNKANMLKCQLLIGYRGFSALAHRTGKLSSNLPAIVYQGDQFSLKLGTGRQLGHVPTVDPAKRDEWLGAYAVVEFRDGRTDFEWMTRQEIEKVKHCSESASEAWSPWRRFEDEMIKKSPIRRMAKRLCLSSEDMTLVEAAVRDEYREMGVEETQAAVPAIREPQRSLPASGSNGQRNQAAKPAIREPQRKADSQPNDRQAAGPTKPGDATSIQPPVGSGANGTAPPNGAQSNPITLRGVIGPVEANARSDRATFKSVLRCQEVYFTASLDGGATFLSEVRVSAGPSCPFSSKNADVALRFLGGGDYSGLVAGRDGQFHLLWSDSRNAVPQLWTAPVTLHAKAPSAATWPHRLDESPVGYSLAGCSPSR